MLSRQLQFDDQPSRDLDTGDTGQRDVDQQYVGSGFSGQSEGLLPVCGTANDRNVPLFAKQCMESRAREVVTVRDEDANDLVLQNALSVD